MIRQVPFPVGDRIFTYGLSAVVCSVVLRIADDDRRALSSVPARGLCPRSVFSASICDDKMLRIANCRLVPVGLPCGVGREELIFRTKNFC